MIGSSESCELTLVEHPYLKGAVIHESQGAT
jgi:hypothetical protein